MKKNDFNKNLFNFINSATCSFTCIDTIKNNLLEEGYVQLYENEKRKLNMLLVCPLGPFLFNRKPENCKENLALKSVAT